MKFSYELILKNLEIAYNDAKRNVHKAEDVVQFNKNKKANLESLATDLFMRDYDTLYLKCFIIYDPVMREVFAPNFRDRIVSHFIYNLLMPIYERTFIHDSYSCRVGKGTHFGANRAHHNLASCSNNFKKDTYILQIDISGYFMSINNKLLHDRVGAIINKYRFKKDENGMVYDDYIDFDLLDFLQRCIIFREPLSKCFIVGDRKEWKKLPPNKSMFNSPKGVGLIIGDLMSQVYSNVYLSELDNYVTETLKFKHYGRYVDDAYVMSNDKEKLEELVPMLITFLKDKLGLTLHPHKTKIMNMWKGFTFLGFCIKPYHITIRKRTMHRVRQGFYALAHLLPNDYKKARPEMIRHVLSVINSCFGHLRHGYTYNIRKELIEKNPIFKKYFDFEDDYLKATLRKRVKKYVLEEEEKIETIESK